MTNPINSLETLRAEHNKVRTEYLNKGKELFKDAVRELFNTHEGLEAIIFTCYTMWFNDGDPCYWAIYGPTIVFEGWKNNEEFKDSTYEDIPLYETTEDFTIMESAYEAPENRAKAFKEVDDFLHGNDEIIRDIFGDGFKVVMTRDSIDSYYYDHD